MKQFIGFTISWIIVYSACDLLVTLAILLGLQREQGIFTLSFFVGVLATTIIYEIVFIRPLKRLNRSIMHTLNVEVARVVDLFNNQKPTRLEGDEWKDS